MKKFIVITIGIDEDGEWGHQMCPGLFKSPDSALTEFKKDWSNTEEFEIKQLPCGEFQIVHYSEADPVIEGLIVPIETRQVSGRRA